MTPGQTIRIDTVTRPDLNLAAGIEAFLTYCRSRGLSPHTLDYYTFRLTALRRFLEDRGYESAPCRITRPVIRDFIQHEIERCSASTANHSLISVRAFFNYLVEDEILAESPASGVRKVVNRKPLIDVFSPEQIETVIATCGADFVGLRDRAVILVLLDCGLRASETCGLTADDVNWKEHTLKVLGKGRKERLVSFGRATQQALGRYLARRPELPTSNLFVTWFGEPMNRHRLYELVKTRCLRAGITGVRASPHTFRHTFATSFLRSGGDCFTLQRILGHEDLAMTRRYSEVSQTDALERHRAYSPADRLSLAEPSQGRRKRIV